MSVLGGKPDEPWTLRVYDGDEREAQTQRVVRQAG